MPHQLVTFRGKLVAVLEFCLYLCFGFFDGFVYLFLLTAGEGFLVVPVAELCAGFVERGKPQADFYVLLLLHQLHVLFCLFGFLAQRLDAPLQFGHDRVKVNKVVLRAGKVALCLLLAVAVLGNAGGFLKDIAAFLRADVDHVGNFALSDDGIAVAPHAGIHEQLVDVLQTDGFAVDLVFAVAGAVIPAGDGDLVAVKVERAVGVVDGEHNLRESQRLALRRSAEDHVLHGLDAENPRRLFA